MKRYRLVPQRNFQAIVLLLTLLVGRSDVTAQTRERRNFYGMHNLKDGGTSIPEGMNWTRHMVGEGGVGSSTGCAGTTASGSSTRWIAASFPS